MGLDNFGILIEEQDGVPAGVCIKLIASNASLTNNGNGSFTLITGGGVSDHGALTGKLDDDHTQYSLLAGRSGGQTFIGGIDSGDDLTLNSTSHATKGTITIGTTLVIDEVNERIGINTGANALGHLLTIQGTDGEVFRLERHSNNVNGGNQRFYKSRGSVASPSVLSDGDRTGQIEFWGYVRNSGDTDDDYVRTGYIRSEIDGLDAQGRLGGKIIFYTSSGVSLNPTDKFVIGKDYIEVEEIATATAGTQYDSFDSRFKCSVWDTTNTQAEDRIMHWALVAGSGVHGSEPYNLRLYDNDDNVMFDVDPILSAVLVPDYILHYGDSNTGFNLRTDRITCNAGGVTFIDMQEAAQDNLYIGNGALGVGADIDIYMGTNNAISIAGDTGNITINDQMNFDKTGTADVGTQYPSQDLILTASIWDTTNTQAEDRIITLRNVGGSGAHGSEPYYLSILDNDATEIFQIDPVNSKVYIPTSGYLSVLNDTNTAIGFTDNDQIKLIAGGFSMFTITEIGLNGYVTINSTSGQAGIDIVTKDQDLNDDATVTLISVNNSSFIWVISSNSGAVDEWALCVLGGDGNVILVANSANVVANADTDGNLCIGTAASQEPLVVKNRLGGTRRILLKMQRDS